jgi:hypothetical protein
MLYFTPVGALTLVVILPSGSYVHKIAAKVNKKPQRFHLCGSFFAYHSSPASLLLKLVHCFSTKRVSGKHFKNNSISVKKIVPLSNEINNGKHIFICNRLSRFVYNAFKKRQ